MTAQPGTNQNQPSGVLQPDPNQGRTDSGAVQPDPNQGRTDSGTAQPDLNIRDQIERI